MEYAEGVCSWRIPVMFRRANAKVRAEDIATGAPRDLTPKGSQAFSAWAAFEVFVPHPGTN